MRTEIPITTHRGVVVAHATVDPDNYEYFARFRWHRGGDKGYPRRWVRVGGKRVGVFMHHEACCGRGCRPPEGLRVDHKNRNPFDCRRENLRLATDAENAQNQGSRGGSSEHRGVHWCATRQKWCASGQLDGKKVNLGRFDTEQEAIEVRRAHTIKTMPFSEEARLAAQEQARELVAA